MRSVGVALCLLLAHAAFSEEKEEQRLRQSATVLEEILDIPDAFPMELLDKAECAVVLPSVKKFALGIGGNTDEVQWCAVAGRISVEAGGRLRCVASRAAT